MKKVMFMLAFVLTASLSFANNNKENKSTENKSVLVQDNIITSSVLINSDLFKMCKITHNIIDSEGNLMGSYVYNIEISEGTCSDMSESLKPFSIWLANGMPGL